MGSTMKPFNQLLHNDIMELKSYTGSHDEASYKQLMKKVQTKHGISRTTLYNEISKDVPGSYKAYESRGRVVPLTQKEAIMVKEMLQHGKTTEEIRNTMSIELGFSYSARRVNSVKQQINHGAILESEEPINPAPNNTDTEVNDKPKPCIDINIDGVKTSAELGALVKKLAGAPGAGEFTVNFKGNLRRLFYRLSVLSKLDPKKPVKLNIYGYEREVSPRTIKGCLDQLAGSALTGGMDTDESIRFNIQTLLLNESNEYKRGLYIKPSEIKSLESARRSLISSPAGSGGSALSGGYSLDDVYGVVTFFKPRVKREEVVNYFKSRNIGEVVK